MASKVTYVAWWLGAAVMLQGAVSAQAQSMADIEESLARQTPALYRDAFAKAKLSVQPGVVTFTPSVLSTTVELTNPFDKPVTVELALRMTYPQANASGGLVPDSVATLPAVTRRDMTMWVQGLPARLTVGAHATERIPLTVTVPAAASAGEYWTSIVALARNVVLSVPVTVSGKQANIDAPPINVTTVIPVVFQRRAGGGGIRVGGPTASIAGDSLLRVCVPLHHVGDGHADVLMRVAVRGSDATDTVSASVPMSVFEDVTPCTPFDVRGLKPGAYRVAIDVTGDRPDIPAAARSPIKPAATTAAFEIPAAVRSTATAARVRASTLDTSDSVFTQVELSGKDGPLSKQLPAHVAKAIALGRTPFLDVGATWCGPCRMLARLMRLPAMHDVMRGMYVIHFENDTWSGGDPLPLGGYPYVTALDRNGRPAEPVLGELPITDPIPRLFDDSDALLVRNWRPSVAQFLDKVREAFAKTAR